MPRPFTFAPALLFLVAAPAFAGWSLTQVTTSSDDRDRQGHGMSQRVWMEGSAAKLEMVGADNPMMEPGSYLLVQDGGKKIFLVNPQRKTYVRFDPMAMRQGMDAMGGAGLETRVEDAKMVKLMEEPGPELLGRPTTHYRYRTTYTMVMSMPMGMKTSMATEVVEDVWTTPAAGGGGAGLAVTGAAGGGVGVPPELQRLAETVKATLSGLPLKQVTLTSSKSSSKGSGVMGLLARRAGAAGGDSNATTTMVVEELVETTLPASTFQIPTGYAETEMMQRGPAMPNLGEGGH